MTFSFTMFDSFCFSTIISGQIPFNCYMQSMSVVPQDAWHQTVLTSISVFAGRTLRITVNLIGKEIALYNVFCLVFETEWNSPEIYQRAGE